MLPTILAAGLVLGCSRAPDAAPAPPAQQDWKALFDAWEYPDPIPNFDLVDQDGRAFNLGTYGQDAYVLVGFIFTQCNMPEACPLTMSKMREVQSLWKERAALGGTQGRKLKLLTLTLDPEHDDPPALKRYGRRHQADFEAWRLATGPVELMRDSLPSLFNVLAFPDGTGGVGNHTVKVALLRPGLNDFKEWSNNEFEPRAIVDLVVAH